MRKIFMIALSVLLTISLTACSGGISGDEAKAHIGDFLEAVETDDFEAAAALMHPDINLELQGFFENIETDEMLDFSEGIEIVRYTGFSSALYDSDVRGSSYELDMDVTVGGRAAEMEIEVVKNDNGYGIYHIDIDAD